jgi:uncharacterized delta-60 repeat protein
VRIIHHYLVLGLLLYPLVVRAASFNIQESQVNISVAQGFNHSQSHLSFVPGAAGFDYSTVQVSSDSAWVSGAVNATTGKLVLSYSSAALSNPSHTATILVTHGENADTVFVTATTSQLNVVELLDDTFRSRTYGIHQNGVNNNGVVVALDPLTNTPVGSVTVGIKPTSMALSNDGAELFVINAMGKSISVIELATLRVVETIPLNLFDLYNDNSVTANIAVGPGNIIYYVDGGGAPILRVFDRLTKVVLQSHFVDLSYNNYGFGDIGLSKDKTHLFGWAQFGWTGGWAGTFVSKFTVNAAGLLTYVQSSSSAYIPGFSRDPVETPVLFSSDDETVFVKKWVMDPANVLSPRTTLPTEVYSISPGGEIAITSTGIYSSESGNLLKTLPVNTSIHAVTSDYARLVYFNTTTKTLHSLNLPDYVGAEALGMNQNPPNGAVVLSPEVLEWSPIGGVDTYDIYLGTDQTVVTNANTTSPEYLARVDQPHIEMASPLIAGTTYYWRIDSLQAGGVVKGGVQSFTVSAVASSLFKINASTVQGHGTKRNPLELTSSTQGINWSASSDKPWVGFSSSSGTTPASLEVVLNASDLVPGVHTATITFAGAGGTLFTLPVKFTVDTLRLTILKSDPSSRLVYGISEDTSLGQASKAYLLELDSQTETILRVVPVGRSVTDLALHQADNRLYVPNWQGGALLAIDRSSFKLVRTYGFSPAGGVGSINNDVYRVAAGKAGRLVVEEYDQHVDATLFGTSAGNKITTTFLREGGGLFEPTGRYYYHGDNNSSGAMVRKFDTQGDVFTSMESKRVSSYSYYGSRTIVISEDGNNVFWNGSHFDSNLVEKWSMAKEVYSTTATGSYAFGEWDIFDTQLKQVVLAMPFGTRVSSYNSTTGKLIVEGGGKIQYYELGETIQLSAPVLGAPTPLANSVELKWTDRGLETGFTLQKRLVGSASWDDVTPAPSRNSTAYYISGLTPETAYEFRIKANSPVASSLWSNVVTTTTLQAPPSAPYLYFPAASGLQVRLTWSDSNSEDSYVIERKLYYSLLWETLGTVGANVLRYDDAGLANSTTYFYRVKAQKAGSASVYSNTVSITTESADPPYPATDLRLTSLDDGVMALSWYPGYPAISQNVWRKKGKTGVWGIVAPDLSPQSVQYSDNTLEREVVYYYKIESLNAYGSAFSPEISGQLGGQISGLDRSFGVEGAVVTHFPDVSGNDFPGLRRAIALQNDGKTLMVGTSESGADHAMTMVRFNIDGKLDQSFGSKGKVKSNDSFGMNRGLAVALQSDGKILVAGTSTLDGDYQESSLARYHVNGSLDTSFGNSGVAIAGRSDVNYFNDLVVQPDGKIVCVGPAKPSGYLATRFLANGEVDYTFGDHGIAYINVGDGDLDSHPASIARQSDGKIVLGVTTFSNDASHMTVVRLQTNGLHDPTFGVNGVAMYPLGTGASASAAVATLPNGTILLAGTAYLPGYTPDFAVIRCLANGQLDSTFDKDGVLTASLGVADFAKALSVADNGQITVCGYSGGVEKWSLSLLRLKSDGKLDKAFDKDGKLTLGVPAGSRFGTALLMAGSGKMLISGEKTTAGNTDFGLARLDSKSKLDRSFDSDGFAFVDLVANGAMAEAHASVEQSDGKVIAGGVAYNRPALARYLTDGKLDTTFGNGGLLNIPLTSGSSGAVEDLVVLNNGKILAACHDSLANLVLIRVLPNGTLDTEYGISGILDTGLDTAFVAGTEVSFGGRLARQSNGKILACGIQDFWMTAKRFDENGLPDATFGLGGKAKVTSELHSSSEADDIMVMADESILLAGTANDIGWSRRSLVLAKFTKDGALDTSFSSDGSTSIPYGIRSVSLAVFPEGGVYLQCKGYNEDISNARLYKITAGGLLDDDYGYRGQIEISGMGSYTNGSNMVLDRFGRVYVAGGSDYYSDQWHAALAGFDPDSIVHNVPEDQIMTTDVQPGLNSFTSGLLELKNENILGVGSLQGNRESAFLLLRYLRN